MKKKRHNGKRAQKAASAKAELVETSNAGKQESIDLTEGVDETMLKHLQTTLSMIEERKVSRSEVVALIKRMRQRSIAKEPPPPYPDAEPEEKPG